MDVFGGAPRFLAYPRPVVVQSGTDAVLKCQIGGDPRPAVIWERNNEKIDPQGRYRVFEDGNVYNLIITAVTIEDSGQYICKAKNSIGETYAAATLKVEGEAQEMELREENKPRFLIKPLSTRAGRGEDAVFSCKIWGSPKPDVVWEKDGKKLNDIFESTHFSVGSQDGGWFQLKIFKTRAPDGGVYTCKARNEFGEALAGAVLLVDAGPGHEDEGNRNGYTNSHWKPVPGRCGRPASNRLNNDMMTKTAKVKMFAVTEGKHAKFRCFVTGKPKPEIIWRKDGRLILSGRRYLLYEDREGYFTLKVLYCKQKDNGVYVCAASNTAGQTLSAVHLSVKEPPVQFKQPLIDLEVWERDLAVLECEVPEDSVPITWYLEDRRLQPGAKYDMEQWGTKRRLTIRDIGVDDDGIYLCEMPDGGRSIAEVAVKGTIMRKLPRKVDVLEGENAAFCVEVEKEEMDIHWYKDGVELRETHQTILKSFGRTHILVFVNTNPQDTGQVMFLVGRSKTSSQLRVKAARHCPPSAPVGVQINTERANAALLSWTSAQDSRKNPPSGYVLERQEVGTGSQEWLQCLTTDSATSVEILGDSVPCEADYRFRICSVNKYGKSNNVEFPRTVHLVPVARIQAPLQDALVPEGQDALFSIELTASVIGTWFLNGTQIQEDERFSMRRTRTHQSLRIRGVRDTDNGVEITFIAYGIRDSAALYIQAPLVKFSPLSEMDRNKFVEIGNPIVLYCELSDPAAPVHWYKNGVELQTTEGLHIQSEGTMRRIVIQSAEFSHSGVYCCDAIDDVIRFNVEVEAPSVRFSAVPETERCKKVHCGWPLVLQCKVSEPLAQVQWYKDGAKVPTQSGLEVLSDALLRTLVIHSAEMYHSGLYTCKTKGDSITFNVDVTAPTVTFAPLSEEARCWSVPVGGAIELRCVVSDHTAHVRWFHDETELGTDSWCKIKTDYATRTLSVQSAEMCHSGVYTCTTDDDAMEFTVEVQAIPAPTVFERMRSLEEVRPLELEYGVPDSAVSICWFKDDQLLPKRNSVLEEMRDRHTKNLIVPSPECLQSDLNSCETSEGNVHAIVEYKALSLSSSPTIGVLETQVVEEHCALEPADQSSAQVPKMSNSETEATDEQRVLIIESMLPSNLGSFCATTDDVVQLIVKNEAEKTSPLKGPSSVVQQFEISDPVAKAVWFKDGRQLYPQREDTSETLRLCCSQQHCTSMSCSPQQVQSPIQTFFPEWTHMSPRQTTSNGLSLAPILSQRPVQLHSVEQPHSPTFSHRHVQPLCSSTLRTVIDEIPDLLTPIHSAKEQGHCVDSAIGEASPNTVEVKAPAAQTVDPKQDKLRVKECPEEIHNSELAMTNTNPEHSRPSSTLPFIQRSALRSMTDAFALEKMNKLFLGTKSESISTGQFDKVPLQSLAQSVLSEQPVEFCDLVTLPLLTEFNDLSGEHIGHNQTTVSAPLVNFTDHCRPQRASALSEDRSEEFIYFTQHRVSPQEDRSSTTTVRSNDFQQTSIKPTTLGSSHSLLTKLQLSQMNVSKEVSAEALSKQLQQNLDTSDTHQLDFGVQVMTDCLSETESALEAERFLQKDSFGVADTVQVLSEELLDPSRSPSVQSLQKDLRRMIPIFAAEEKNVNVQMSSRNRCQFTTNLLNISQTVENPNDHYGPEQKNVFTDKVHLEKAASFSGSAPLQLLRPPFCIRKAQNSLHSVPYGQKQHYINSSVGVSSPFVYDLPEQTDYSRWPRTKHTFAPVTTVEKEHNKDHNCLSSVAPRRSLTEQTEVGHMIYEHSVQTKACHMEQTEAGHINQTEVGHIKQTEVFHTEQAEADRTDEIKMVCMQKIDTGHLEEIHAGHIEKNQAGCVKQTEAGDTVQLESYQTKDSSDPEFYFSKTFRNHCVSANKLADEAQQVRITALGSIQKSCDTGEPIELLCEVSDPTEPVVWFKDGDKLCEGDNLQIESEHSKRRLTISSATPGYNGQYSCHTASDSVQFTLDVKAPLFKFSTLSEAQQRRIVIEGTPLALQCELSDASGQVTWFKDGAALLPESGVDIQTEGHKRSLFMPSAELQHSGVYRCESKDDDVQFTVDIQGDRTADNYVKPTVTFLELRDTDRSHHAQQGSPVVLQCQLSQEPFAEVFWSKDGVKVHPDDNTEICQQGLVHTLTIHSAESWHSGVYQCSTDKDKVQFEVAIKGRDPHILPIALSDTHKLVSLGSPIVLQCQVSEPGAQVSWTKDQVELFCKTGLDMKRDGCLRKLMVHSAKPCDAGMYSCSLGNNTVIFSVHVQAPPVTFTEMSKEDLLKNVVEQEELVLSCEVSAPEGAVMWYRDGAEIQSSDNVCIQAKDTRRSLTICSAQLSDSGTFSCRTGDDVLLFKVIVREPPVMIIHPKEDVHLDCHVPEEVILSCELSRANGAVSWFKDGQKLQESDNIRLKMEGPYRRLKILSSHVEDSGEYVCDTDDDSIFFQLNITDPPVRIVSPSQCQMELCQQTAERMVLSCEISRPNAVVRWYRDGLEVEENQNLLIEEDGVYRRLIIPKTTVQDSAEYVCDTADDSMTFFVNVAEPPVRFIRPRKTASKVEKAVGESVVLDCEVSRANAEVTWKRNGEEVEENRNISLLEEGVNRQLTIHCVSPEDSGQYVCDAKDDLMDFILSVKEPPVTIIGKPERRTEKQFVVSDDIVLVCELSRSNAAVIWSKDGYPIEDEERVCSEEQGVFRSLVVLNAKLNDSGEYSCDTGDDCMSFYITVKEPPVKIVGNSGAPEHHLLLAGEDLVLECEVSCPHAEVQWLRNGHVLQSDERIHVESFEVIRKFMLSNLQTSDSGEYTCDATDDKMVMIVDVQEPPATFKNKPTSPCTFTAFEGENLTLSAELTREQKVRWLKNGGLLNAENIHISSSGSTQHLTLHPLQLTDSGEYVCEVPYDQMAFTVLVKEMKLKFFRMLENTVALRGQSLTLQCEVNKAKGDVQWLKNGQEVVPCRRFTIRAHGRERSFTIHEVSAEDGGEYSCESTDDKTTATVTVQAPRVVEFIAGLRTITVREGEDAIFKCVVSPEDVELVWQINGLPPPSQRATVTKNGTCHTLRLSYCTVADSGRVTSDAEGQVSWAELHVQEEQLVFTRQLRALTVEEFGEAVLEVEVCRNMGEVQWMRQGVLLHAGPKYSLLKSGQTHSLTVHALVLADSGCYSCETLHDRTQAQLTVQPRKISIKKGLSDIRTTERETASFEVHLSHPELAGTWFRNGTQLKPSAHFRISSKNLVHSLTICNLSVEDTGTFVFSVGNLKTTARLVVKEPPVMIFRKLEDQRFPERAIISIECELSRHNVDVKWMKNGVEVKPNKELRIYAMGRKRFLQVMKCKVSDSGVYTCDAGDATTSCTVEVYERELLLLKGLESLEMEEDQNAVFMCELSVEDIPGEWFKRGEKIQPTSTIKIRQEGTKHFLLMCNIRPEDSGEIKFVARNVESAAFLDVEELPVNIVKPLQDQTVLEKTRVLLDCIVSTPRCSCRWYKGINVILPSERFEICSEGCTRKLIIQQVALEDEGTYSVQVGEHSCSAKLKVEAQSVSLVRGLSDLEVVAPAEACLEVEVSVPVQGAPVWTLNSIPLQPGPQVVIERMGTVHRLTFRQTSEETSGEVEFISGKTRSCAHLSVIPDPQ